jgi:two-component system NtrC family sensor kinase
MPRLVILQGPNIGKRFELAPGSTTVGRHSTNAVSIDDPRASRKHCELNYYEGTVTLRDLGSGNGTLLNERVTPHATLANGDRIHIGDTLFLFSTDDTNIIPPNALATSESASFVLNPDPNYATAILRSVPAEAGSRILAQPELAGTEYLRQRLANLAVMYEASNAVSDILDLDELLVRIVDLVLKTTEGDHGCALLLDPESGELMPKAIRSRGKRSEGELNISRTVVDHVLAKKEGVLVSDASADERFRGGVSIAKHQIREVICVPMRGRHDTVGVLFLDTQAPTAKVTGRDPVKFTEDHLRLAVAVGHQAALAIEENRYYQGMLQSERLAAIGQTIAALSHHIKNIMQGVRFGSDMVRMGLPALDKELLAKGWRLVEKNQAKIDDLILDMLSFSKEREPAIEATDLNGVVGEVLEVVRGRAEGSGIALEFQPMPELGPVPCDADGIHRALLNIVSNAVDAVEDVESPRVTVTVRKVEGFAEVSVTDNGPGIPPAKREEIFKPFVSTKGGKGTGLGLPVSRKTLREHGGDVIVNSEPGEGTEFVLRLPLTFARS